MQQLNNPTINQRDREIIHAILGGPHENNFGSGIMPNNAMNSQLPIPNMAGRQPIDALTPEVVRNMHFQAMIAERSKPSSQISPLPNGVPQRIPSPRELQFHTQSIMQNALIKKKLEEQRENYRKRQEQQQNQIQQQAPNQQQLRIPNNFPQMHTNVTNNQHPPANLEQCLQAFSGLLLGPMSNAGAAPPNRKTLHYQFCFKFVFKHGLSLLSSQTNRSITTETSKSTHIIANANISIHANIRSS